VIDFNTLLLLNMAGGYALLAAYVHRGLDDPDQKRWAPAFAMCGLIAFLFGGYLTIAWTLPGPYNLAFGEMSVFLGVLFLAAALALARGWSLVIIAWYAVFSGLAAILLGARMLELGLTKMPWLTAIGFALSGLGGVFAAPTLLYLRHDRLWRTVAAAVLIGAALIWALDAYAAYWSHMDGFKDWKPLTMRLPAGK